MATQILGRNHTVLVPDRTDVNHHIEENVDYESREREGSVARGFFFAMVFNVGLVLLGFAAWEIWRALR